MTPAFFVAKLFSPFDKNRLTRTNVRIIIQTPTESGELNIAIRAHIARSENSAMAVFLLQMGCISETCTWQARNV